MLNKRNRKHPIFVSMKDLLLCNLHLISVSNGNSEILYSLVLNSNKTNPEDMHYNHVRFCHQYDVLGILTYMSTPYVVFSTQKQMKRVTGSLKKKKKYKEVITSIYVICNE